MRPARKGPENRTAAEHRGPPADASMRPARKGPENRRQPRGHPQLRPLASMRPARKGPENRTREFKGGGRPPGFNEAGPQGAGKPFGPGAGSAGAEAASMRPARKGPENPVIPPSRSVRTVDSLQ